MITIDSQIQVQIVSPATAKHVARLEMIRAASHKAPKAIIAPGTVTVTELPEADQTVRLNAQAKFASLHKSFLAVWESHNA